MGSVRSTMELMLESAVGQSTGEGETNLQVQLAMPIRQLLPFVTRFLKIFEEVVDRMAHVN